MRSLSRAPSNSLHAARATQRAYTVVVVAATGSALAARAMSSFNYSKWDAIGDSDDDDCVRALSLRCARCV